MAAAFRLPRAQADPIQVQHSVAERALTITHSTRMKSKLLGVLCIAVLCITLSLGLWPFYSPRNEVSWLNGPNGLAFGKYGTVMSPRPLDAHDSQSDGSVEIWLQPDRPNASATFLAFYRPEQGLLFTLNQSLTDLEVAVDIETGSEEASAHFYVEEAFGPALRQRKPVFISLTSGREGTMVYLDGVLAKAAPGFLIPAFNGRLIVGDSPRQPNSFRGQILGLAIYDVELSGAQVLRHYRTWTQTGRPDVAPEERNIALYLFDEHTGNTFVQPHRRRPGSRHSDDLYVVDKIALEPFWKEFNFSRSYWTGNLKNIIGFMPAGFCFYAYFVVARPIKRPSLVALVLGVLVSLAIEILQIFLPTRDSGTTDIITNTIGTYLGVLCYRYVYLVLAQEFPRLSWLAA